MHPHHFTNTLTGKTAVVTGAGRGIGKAIAVAFARAGCNVACVSRTDLEVEQVASLINASVSFEAKAFVCDISDIDAVYKLVPKIRAWVDRPISILINNAGLARIEAVEHQHDMIAWNHIIATNLNGPVSLSYQVLPDMLGCGDGVIMSIGSRNAVYPIPYMMAYSVSKTGLLRFHENLEQEIRGKGVRNFYVVPGNVDTSILTARDAVDGESFRHSPGVRRMVQLISDSEKLAAEHVANTCVMLAAENGAIALSGRYVDTEGDLGTLWRDILDGSDSRCVNQGLYRLKMDML